MALDYTREHDIDYIYKHTYINRTPKIKDEETNLFDNKRKDIQKNKNIDWYNNKIQSHGTYAISHKINVDDTKNLVFSVHVKTVFYDESDNIVDSLYTPSYPENVEIQIPERTKYILTVFHEKDADVFKVVQREKSKEYEYFDSTSDPNNLNPETKNPLALLRDLVWKSKDDANRRLLYAKDFGFVGDGKTDNSQALLDLESAIEHNNDYHTDYNFTIIFDSGEFLFTKPYLKFLSRKRGNCCFGLDIVGQGHSTIFRYNPDDSIQGNEEEHFFIQNNNSYAGIRISDIYFETKLENKKVSFCKQIADPFPQHILFERVYFNNVYTTLELKGSDCNSEVMFIDCKWNGKNNDVLKAVKPAISAQFLNYWFINPDFQCTGGSFVNLERGGNVNIIGGNLIHKNTSGGESSGGTFFKLGSGIDEALGICRFLCIGARFECSVNRNSTILESKWGNTGIISFISCDDGAKNGSGVNAGYVDDDCEEHITISDNYKEDYYKVVEKYNFSSIKEIKENYKKYKEEMDEKYKNGKISKEEYDEGLLKKKEATKKDICNIINGVKDEELLHEFKFIAIRGLPSVKFENCTLHGKHIYDLRKNTDMNLNSVSNSIVYDGNIYGGYLETPFDFIDMKIDENNYANKILPAIKLINLNKKFSMYEGLCYREKELSNNIMIKKYANLKTQVAAFPFTNVSNDTTTKTKIPINSLITGIVLYAPENYSEATNPNNLEIYIGNEGDKTHHTLFSIIGDEVVVNNSTSTEIVIPTEKKGENCGLNYSISFEKGILADTEELRTITFKRTTSCNGAAVKDKLVALVEFI